MARPGVVFKKTERAANAPPNFTALSSGDDGETSGATLPPPQPFVPAGNGADDQEGYQRMNHHPSGPGITPRTSAVRKAMDGGSDALAADLLFLESWRMGESPLPGAMLRAGQISRANPALLAEIDAELRRRL